MRSKIDRSVYVELRWDLLRVNYLASGLELSLIMTSLQMGQGA